MISDSAACAVKFDSIRHKKIFHSIASYIYAKLYLILNRFFVNFAHQMIKMHL